jgi:hypothetical protein
VPDAGQIDYLARELATQKTSAQDLRIGRDRFRALRKLEQPHGKEKRG